MLYFIALSLFEYSIFFWLRDNSSVVKYLQFSRVRVIISLPLQSRCHSVDRQVYEAHHLVVGLHHVTESIYPSKPLPSNSEQYEAGTAPSRTSASVCTILAREGEGAIYGNETEGSSTQRRERTAV